MTSLSQMVLLFFCMSAIGVVPVSGKVSDDSIAKYGSTENNDDASLFFGIANRDITPDPAVLDWVTGRPYGEVHDQIYVRAAVIGDGEERAVIISWDLVDVGGSATGGVREAVSGELGVPGEVVLINEMYTSYAVECL